MEKTYKLRGPKQHYNFDFDIDRTETLKMYNTRNSEKEYPDVGVIFKIPPMHGTVPLYRGVISLSLLEKLILNPTRKVNIIDKLYLLNCPDPVLSEILNQLHDIPEVNYKTVRQFPRDCVDGFCIGGCTVTGEDIFPKDIQIERVPLSYGKESPDREILNNILGHSPDCFPPRDPFDGKYYVETREDLVYFISNTERVQIYFSDSIDLPSRIPHGIGVKYSSKSWANLVCLVEAGTHEFDLDEDFWRRKEMEKSKIKEDTLPVVGANISDEYARDLVANFLLWSKTFNISQFLYMLTRLKKENEKEIES